MSIIETILILIQVVMILLTLMGIYYVIKVVNIVKVTDINIIKARIFLNKDFVLKILFLLVITCSLFFIYSIAEFLCITNNHDLLLYSINITLGIKKVTMLGVLLITVLTCRLWYSMLKLINHETTEFTE